MHEEAASRRVVIAFTATGAEYFRVWQLNLLLTLLSLGFYRPFAKARKLRFLAAATRIDGHALSFDGEPWRMFRGHLVMLLLFGAYAASGYVSAGLSLLLLALLALLWPGLWRAGLRYRLAHTRWRGLRFAFVGSLGGAYRAQLPWMLPPLLLAGLTAWLAPDTSPGDLPELPSALWWLWGGLSLACLPLGLALLKRYQLAGYRFAGEAVQQPLPLKAFVGIGAATLSYAGVALIAAIFAALLLGLVLSAVLGKGAVATVGLTAFGVLAYLLLLIAAVAYLMARVQNTVWNGASNRLLTVRSDLNAGDYTRLALRNWLFIALSLGFYRPWALVRERQMRWQAVALTAHQEPASWRPSQDAASPGASGEMSGDFFGLDLGW